MDDYQTSYNFYYTGCPDAVRKNLGYDSTYKNNGAVFFDTFENSIWTKLHASIFFLFNLI